MNKSYITFILTVTLIIAVAAESNEKNICNICVCIEKFAHCSNVENITTIPKYLRYNIITVHFDKISFSTKTLSKYSFSHDYYKQIRDLRIFNSRLTAIAPHAFNLFLKLSTLIISGNDIEKLIDDTFNGLVLETLSISNNPGIILSVYCFRGLSVKYIYLMSNNLKTITYNMLRSFDFREVNFYNNSITTAKPRLAKIFIFSLQTYYPKFLDLSKNPIFCSCHLRWYYRLLAYFYRRNILYRGVSVICNGPQILKGKNLMYLQNGESDLICENDVTTVLPLSTMPTLVIRKSKVNIIKLFLVFAISCAFGIPIIIYLYKQHSFKHL